MLLKIHLISDLCIGSGDIFNSRVDTDIVYDQYGLPYIPAKRLKGCIREAYLELVDFGQASEESYIRLFGKEGNEPSLFTINNAYLSGYVNLCRDLYNEKNKELKNPLNVLDLYTYTRTQTAVDLDSGVAEDKSLRTLRVIKKGETFETELSLSESVGHKDRENLILAIQSVKHIGVGRTRGLGLVEINVCDKHGNSSLARSSRSVTVPSNDKIYSSSLNGHVKLSYTICLESPMICKSPQGNQAKVMPYIEGGKVLGLIAGALGNDDYRALMNTDEEIIVSNAYISVEDKSAVKPKDKRCIPIKASLWVEKDSSFDKNGELIAYDRLSEKGHENVQTALPPMLFSTEDGIVGEVETEINYHHRRPNDKSIGRAMRNDDSSFYQLESICKGQKFQGFILTSEQNAQLICTALGKMENVRMGYSKNSEYGAVSIKVECCDPDKDEDKQKANKFVIKLNAPAILYNKQGMPSAEVDDLTEYLEMFLGTDDLNPINSALTYDTIGGFNVTWGRRKPIFTALGKGSTILYESKSGVDLPERSDGFIGERVSEGYGEIEISTKIPVEQVFKNAQYQSNDKDQSDWNTHTKIIERLQYAQNKKKLENIAREKADKTFDRHKSLFQKKEIDATLSRLIMFCKDKDNENYNDVKKQVNGIEINSKRELAETILKGMEDMVKDKGPETFGIVSQSYLNELKYKLRPGKDERRQAQK